MIGFLCGAGLLAVTLVVAYLLVELTDRWHAPPADVLPPRGGSVMATPAARVPPAVHPADVYGEDL